MLCFHTVAISPINAPYALTDNHRDAQLSNKQKNKGLTVEQRKRLTIAVELVSNPGLIFMDEPTSGLDARAAATVMRAVRAVAAGGRAVMVTIHQPSVDVFEGFGRLYLMQRGGRLTYFGDLGPGSRPLVDYLQAVPGTPPLPPGANPGTWMLEATGAARALRAPAAAGAAKGAAGGGGGGAGGNGRKGSSGGGGGPAAVPPAAPPPADFDWPAHYAASALAASNAAAAASLAAACLESCPPLAAAEAPPFRVQLAVLLHKFLAVYWRAVSYNRTRIYLSVVLGLLYGSVYWGIGRLPDPATPANVQNVMGVVYSAINFMGMVNLYQVMPVAGAERVVFYRERGAAMYDPFAYGLAVALVELPFLAAQALLFVPIVYFAAAFEATLEQVAFFFAMFLLCVTVSGVGAGVCA